MVSSQKKALRTSFRSATQATDSTWRGWMAKRAATIKLGHSALVQESSNRNKSKVLAMWKKRFIRWCPAGATPKS